MLRHALIMKNRNGEFENWTISLDPMTSDMMTW